MIVRYCYSNPEYKSPYSAGGGDFEAAHAYILDACGNGRGIVSISEVEADEAKWSKVCNINYHYYLVCAS